MMLQPYDIHDSEIACDTTSVLTTPFSVKDILNMNISNDEYCSSSIKKEPFSTQQQFWDNTVFTPNEYNYYCNNSSENRHYWNSDNVYNETYVQHYNPDIQPNESPIRISAKDDGYNETDNPSKFYYFHNRLCCGLHFYRELCSPTFPTKASIYVHRFQIRISKNYFLINIKIQQFPLYYIYATFGNSQI